MLEICRKILVSLQTDGLRLSNARQVNDIRIGLIMKQTKNMSKIKMILSSLFTAAALSVFLTSCGLIEINGSGYRSLGQAEKARVKVCDQPIDSLKDDGNVYQVTAGQVKDYLKCHDDVIIYKWLSFCRSVYCVSPAHAKKVCEERGYTFCLVACDYEYIDRIFGSGIPALAIDINAYGTDNYKKYTKYFFRELVGADFDETSGLFHRFHKGRYVESYDSVDDVKQLMLNRM